MTTKPKIIISSLDAERLDALLERLPDSSFPGKAALLEELARAEVVDPEAMPPTVVTMNSTVRFRFTTPPNDEFTLTLVYPKDVDPAGGTISILAPIGSALLGLAEGNEIEWPKPGGGNLRVCIQEIISQPERDGQFYR